MNKLNILQRATLLIKGYSEKTFRIIRLTTLLLMVTVLNVFGGTLVSDYANLNLDREKDPAAIMQKKRVTGTVTDKNGTPLSGVNVVVVGTTQGVTTDIHGKYSIEIPEGGDSLRFTFIGMEDQKISIGSLAIINVAMSESTVGLEEIVVVGYGSQKKRDIIGSISTVKANIIETTAPSTNFNSLLQGQAAGVSVQSKSGRLGDDVDIKVRGLSSISASTSPLWIIDGMPVITSNPIDGSSETGSAAQSPMSLINPSDIASIEVLKDAAATSIYGSRGSNGVIMVTTKSGEAGKASITFDYSTGISDLPLHKVKFASTAQWFQIKDSAKIAYRRVPYAMTDFYSQKPYATEKLTRAQAEAINTDWFKETMQRGSFQNINFSTVGGDMAIRYYISGDYRKDNGVMTNEDLERYGVRANIDVKPTRSVDIGTKINLSLSKSNRGKNVRVDADDGNKAGIAGGFGYVCNNTVPFEPVHSLATPRLYYNPLEGNAVATSDPSNLVEQLDNYRVLASIYGEYALPFIKGLSARTELSVDYLQSNRNLWVSEFIRVNGSLGVDNASTSRNVNYNLLLKYNKVFGDHVLDLTAGAESERYYAWFRSMEGQQLIGTYQQLGTPTLLDNMSSGQSGEGYLRSYFGRANYKFKDRYLLGISVRRDGSSVFTSEYRWGSFIAFSAGWVLSDESFMGEFGKSNFLKLRGSYGQTGNASIPGNLNVSQYDGSSAYGSADILGLNGTLLSSIGVSNLTWESTNSLDLGLDFGFFNNRINGSLAYYNKYVKGLLLAASLPPSSGIGSIWGNIGDLDNTGIEFNVTSSNLGSKKLKWLTTINIAFNHNEVKKLTPDVDNAGTGMVELPYITKVGTGVRDYYLAEFAGINPQTGLSQIYALDHDYYTKTGETRHLKNAEGKDSLLLNSTNNAGNNYFHMKGENRIPKYYGGITNTFSYMGFDLSILITFSGGNYILDWQQLLLETTEYNGNMAADYASNYWKKPGDNAKYQRLDWNGNIKMEDGTTVAVGNPRNWTSQYLYKGDFVKLKSISLGYTFPKFHNLFQAFRLYASVGNIYTLTKYPGWDPEGAGLVLQYDLPQLFSATIGATIKF